MKQLIEKTKKLEKRIKTIRKRIISYKNKIRLMEAALENLRRQQSSLHIKIQQKAEEEGNAIK